MADLKYLHTIYIQCTYILLYIIYFFREIVERLCNSIDKYGPDCWWEYSVKDLIGLDMIEKLNIAADDIEKGNVNSIYQIFI